jgi:ATP-binding cassette, subfamily B, bacterial MsbA
VSRLVRLVPFIWQQRARLLVSFVLAAMIAMLSAGSLMIIFPVVKVLLQDGGLGAQVQSQLQAAREAEVKETARLDVLNRQIEKLRRDGPSVELARAEDDRAQGVRELNHATDNIAWCRWFGERVLPHLPEDRFLLFQWLMLLLLGMTVVKCGICYFQEVMVSGAVERTMQSLRQRLFRTTLRLDHQTLALETTPQLMSRFIYDLQQVSVGLTLLGSKAIIEPLKAVVCIACAFGVNWRLTALSFACAPIAALLFGRIGRQLKRASRRQMESMSRVYRVLSETLTSFRTVLAFRNERLHRRRLSQENRNYYDKAMKIVRIDSLSSPSVEFLAMIGVFLAALPGAYLVLCHQTTIWGIRLATREMDVPQLALLYTLLGGVLDPARRIASIFSKVKKSSAACERIFGWMDQATLVTSDPNAEQLPRHHASIEIERVMFRYAAATERESRPPALDDVSVTIPFGATVAVVGGNGSGKSTLVNLLPRLFDPQSGTVRIDGVDIRHVDPRSLRKQIGVVTQETLLFDESIEDNIRYGTSGATSDEVHDAARRAHVTSFVAQLPDGMGTRVGDRGHRLSGGQRQRVALARAILRQPAILILDEATSAIDAQSEQLIQASLGDLARGRTTFIVTHAMTPTLLEHVTHVLVMDRGRAAAFGRHEDVLATCPVYQSLFSAQVARRVA